MKRLIGILLISVLSSGCSSLTYRTNESFGTYFEQKKTVVVIMPDMKIFKMTAGGVNQYQDDWSAQAKKFMQEELQKELSSFETINFVYLDKDNLSEMQKEFLDEQIGIFHLVAHSIVAHTYDPATLMKHKKAHFDYTLGAELRTLKELTGAETVLFVNGRNYIWTAGRSTLAVLSMAVGLFSGVYIPIPVGKEWLTASLVDVDSGDVLWFNYLPMPGDMRMASINNRLSKKLFRDFPETWRNKERWEIRKEEKVKDE